ncbi:MAG TPA: hypothetical protein VHP33_02560 [Polyangiaceae bacterium]|nr:hypothetical protein [Polyangiaceae bacterium]
MADLRQFRHGLTAAVLGIAGLCAACSSDQRSPNTPEDVPPAEAPQDASPPAGDAAPPNGEPTNTPPAEPSPQGSNGNAPSNMIGAPKNFAAASRPLDPRYP